MILKKYEELPKQMKNDEVKKYYDILANRKCSLIIKRFFDIVFSFTLLVLLFPIILIIGLLIKIDSRGPVFYRQERVTTNGKIFKIFKFRTMIQNADKIGSLVTVGNDSRVTRMGKVIRKTRLDEFPQLINVLLGDMSFVGTRPEVKKYIDCYTDEMKATLLMPAGVTSEASIKYRNESKILKNATEKGKDVDSAYVEDVLPGKMKYNLDYINKFSFFYDIKVCINTVIEVLK